VARPVAANSAVVVNLPPSALQQINAGGRSQFRLAFSTDDNDNAILDTANFFASEVADVLRRPKLNLTLGSSSPPPPTNQPPSFTADPTIRPTARVNEPYAASLAGGAADPDASDILTFSKISGPAWLTVASAGALSGTPGPADVGSNSWTVQVSDGRGGTDQTVLSITVDPASSGPTTATFESIAAEDGRVRESTEEASVGGSASASALSLTVGDDPLDRQLVVIVSFDTSSMPDTASITSATMELTKATFNAGNPFAVLGSLVVDIKNGTFGTVALEVGDFAAAASGVAVATISDQGTSALHSVDLSAALAHINKTGRTQIRLRFTTGDDDDLAADTANFASSDNTNTALRPRLIVTFQ
jgi:hypothetical protein